MCTGPPEEECCCLQYECLIEWEECQDTNLGDVTHGAGGSVGGRVRYTLQCRGVQIELSLI